MMIRLVFYAILIIFILRAAQSLWRGIVEGLNQPSSGNVPARGVHMVRDPVCGTFVIPDRALSVTLGRDAVYFCSVKCRDAYRTRPSDRTNRVQGRTA